MRDIKFRGKDRENWHYGDLVKEIRHHDNKLFDGVITHIKNYEYNNGTYVGDMFPVNPETVGQYTGLKDKNGKEIYEGDIINFDYIKERNYEIVFEDGTYWIRDKDNQYISLHEVVEICKRPNNWKVEVIGNIYDNSELLEEGE